MFGMYPRRKKTDIPRGVGNVVKDIEKPVPLDSKTSGPIGAGIPTSMTVEPFYDTPRTNFEKAFEPHDPPQNAGAQSDTEKFKQEYPNSWRGIPVDQLTQTKANSPTVEPFYDTPRDIMNNFESDLKSLESAERVSTAKYDPESWISMMSRISELEQMLVDSEGKLQHARTLYQKTSKKLSEAHDELREFRVRLAGTEEDKQNANERARLAYEEMIGLKAEVLTLEKALDRLFRTAVKGV